MSAAQKIMRSFCTLCMKKAARNGATISSPLGARLPTRLWYKGLVDSQMWTVQIPADLADGRYAVFTGLYRASDHQRLPAYSPEGLLVEDARVPLGFLMIHQ